MMSSLAISDTVLAFASAFGVFLMAQRKSFAEIHKLSATCAMIGFAFMALGAITGTLRYGISPAWRGPHEMLTNVALFLSPPMIGIAVCLGLTTRSLSGPTWGRIVLGICVLYEVCRWYGLEVIYRDFQVALLAVAIFVLVLRSPVENTSRLLIIAAMSSIFTGVLIVGTQGTLAGYLRLDLFRYLIALGNLLLSSGLYFLLKNHHPTIEE